jgi:hypothetical protein
VSDRGRRVGAQVEVGYLARGQLQFHGLGVVGELFGRRGADKRENVQVALAQM